MKVWAANIVRVTAATALLATASVKAPADEGMWLVTQIASLGLPAKGLKIDPPKIFRSDGPCIGRAIVNLGGGTGSFVSSQGLVLTNHHVAYGGIQSLSTPEHNYVRDGFLAKTLDDERRVRNYTATITLACEDVTAQVLKDLPEDADAEARSKFIDRAMQAVRKSREAKRTDKHLRFRVAELFNGAQYLLYTTKQYRDVRLVYAPPAAIGEFGGDPDNWMWPRHCGDFSYMRVYASPKGEPAAFSADNVPLKPESWLKVTTKGVKKGDLTFIMGFPARTNRQRTSFSARYHRDEMLPLQIAGLQRQVDQILAQSKDDEATAIRLLSRLKGLQNALKNFTGKVEWLKRKKLVEAMEADERAALEFLATKPELQRAYGDIFIKVKQVYRAIRARDRMNNALRLLRGLEAYKAATLLTQLQKQMARPEEERSRNFKEKRIERTRSRAVAALKKGDAEAMKKRLRRAILALSELPPGLMPAGLASVVSGVDAVNREAQVEQYINAVLATQLLDSAIVEGWVELKAEEIAALDDPLLGMVRELNNAGTKSLTNAQIGFRLKEERRRFYELRRKWKPDVAVYPDADRSLRFTFGRVEGYRARDAVAYDYITSLAGAVEKESGKEPFANPPRLLDLHAKRNFGRYRDAHVDDVPIAFVHDTDITGGNSGSPVLNAEGKMIGIAFDGNWEAITSDYRFDGELTRTISVDMRYVLFITDKYAGASRLLEEMGVARGL